MAVLRFDPFRGFETFAKKMNDLAREAEKGVNIEYGSFAPVVDIYEDDSKIYIQAEMPGVEKDQVKVTLNDENVLIIKGQKKRNPEYTDKDEDTSFMRMERRFGDFSRSFMVPDNIKKDSVNAKFNDGVLNITLEKVAPEKPKEVEINIS